MEQVVVQLQLAESREGDITEGNHAYKLVVAEGQSFQSAYSHDP